MADPMGGVWTYAAFGQSVVQYLDRTLLVLSVKHNASMRFVRTSKANTCINGTVSQTTATLTSCLLARLLHNAQPNV